MRKILGIILKIFLGLILLILILLFTLPVIFKEKIKIKIEQKINESVNAKVKFGDYKLGFLRNFPKLSFSLENVSVVGIDRFENDTLAASETFELVLNLSSLFKKSGYEINSVVIEKADINIIVLKDGSFNWDIMNDSTDSTSAGEPSSGMKILLEQIKIINSSVSYTDHESDIATYISKVNGFMKGDLTGNETNLEINLQAGEVTYIMDGIKYLNKARADSKINLLARLDSMKFYLRDNFLLINDLKVNFAGMVEMPYDDIGMDLTFKTDETSFKSLLSIIPAVYSNDFRDLKTGGSFVLNGSAKGVYSDADSTMPDITLDLKVTDGLISYPSLPEQVKNISLESDIFIDGNDMDKTTVSIKRFHMELAGNPFDLTFALKTPVSDPDFNGSMNGTIDLASVSRTFPVDSMSFSGLIKLSVKAAGRMSMIEKQDYENFNASGTMSFSGMTVSMTGYPETVIQEAGFEFTPGYALLKNAELTIGQKSDFSLNGRLENYIPYLFRNEVIRGNLMLHSKNVDLSEIMSSFSTGSEEAEDTTALAAVTVPKNLDFDFNALIDQFIYDKIKVQNVKGNIRVKDGIISFRDTGMDLLGGTVAMNANYDTRDTLKPFMKADLRIEALGIKDAFNTFNTIRMLAPTAKGINGKINAGLSYSSLLGRDLMPVVATISGGGRLQSDEVTLVESAVYNKMKETLKLSDSYTNTFKDINVSFKISNGRIFVSPFNVKAGNIKMNIGGDHGIDQTLNYAIKTEIPRSELGSSINSLIDNLSAQASAFGIAIKPSEIIKINVMVTGTFLKPVITPFTGNTPPGNAAGFVETTETAIKEAAGKGLEQAKDKARIEAEIQADKLVKEAEEQGNKLREEAAEAAEKIRQEADIQAQRLIKDSESKNPWTKYGAKIAADSLKKEADKKAGQLIQEADNQADKLLEEAKQKRLLILNSL